MSTSTVRRILPGALIGVALFVLLAAFVGADPAQGVTRSSSPWSDEGFNTIAAHNLALFGHFSTDDWNLWIVNLPFTLAVAAVFSVFGAGIVQARLLMIAATALAAALIAVGLRRPFGQWTAAAAAIAFGTSVLTLYYGRMVYLEDLQVLALVAGALTLLRVERDAVRLGVVAGALFAIAIGIKPNGLFAVVGLLAFVAIGQARSKPVRRWTIATVATIALAGLAWAVLFALPNLDALRTDLRILNPLTIPDSPRAFVSNVLAWPGSGGDDPVRVAAPLFIAAAAGIVVAAVRWRSLDPDVRRIFIAALGWFVVPLLVLLVVEYRPNRYLYPLIPALAILAAPAIAAIAEWAAPRLRYGRAVAAVAISVALAVEGLVLYAHWMSEATYTLPAAQAQMRDAVPADSIVVGPDAPTFLMSAPVIVIVPEWGGPPPVNAGDLYTERGARWYTAPKDIDVGPIAQQHPSEWAARQTIVCAPWFHGQICLYRLP